MSACPVRVLIVFSSGEIGGAERSLTRMAAVPVGDEVAYSLLAVGSGSTWEAWAKEMGVNALSCPVFGRGVFSLRGIRRLFRTIRHIQPDVIYMVGIRAAILLRLFRPWMPRAQFVHAIRSTFVKGTPLAARMLWTERLLGRWTACYIANSTMGATSLAQIACVPENKILVIHNGIEIPDRPRDSKVAANRYIAVVANINSYKGHIQFLAIVQRLHARLAGIEVVLVGRDELHGAVQREISARALDGVVKVIGFSSNPEQYVSRARVFALPSRVVEGSPTAVMEALALGVPVVAFRIGGIPEIVESDASGILVEPEDDAAFETALEKILTDDALAARLGQSAREHAVRNFAIKDCALRHGELWKRLVAGNAERTRFCREHGA